MRRFRIDWLKVGFIGWGLLWVTIVLVIAISLGTLLAKAAFGHPELQSKIPSPPATIGVVECFETHKEAILNPRYRSDREFNYNNVLKACVLDADEDHQFKELIMQMMLQMGVKL